jgi:hypothetical protein
MVDPLTAITMLYGMSETSSANSRASALTAEQLAIQQEMLDMAKLREGYDKEMREDQKKQIEDYMATLKEVFDRLGAREVIDPVSIQNDANIYFDQNMNDLNRSIDRVNSQGYAQQASRGMGDSSVNDDRKEELTREYSDLISKARTDAQGRAFDKATKSEALTNQNRSNITSEYDQYFAKPFDMMNMSRKSDGAGALNSAGTMTNAMAEAANKSAADTSEAFGAQLEDLRERYFPHDNDKKKDD